jgi:transcriptional regulator with XRE-family HTH domain
MDVGMIRAAIARQRLPKRDLAKALGVSPPTLTAMLNGERALKVEELPTIVAYLGLDCVTVVGTIGQGGVIDEQPPGTGRPSIQLPYVPRGDWEAFRVAGDVLEPRYGDGDVIIAWATARRPVVSYFGVEAILSTTERKNRILGHLSPPTETPIHERPVYRSITLQQIAKLDRRRPTTRARLYPPVGRRYLDVEVINVFEICGQLRAYQLQDIRDGLQSAIPLMK